MILDQIIRKVLPGYKCARLLVDTEIISQIFCIYSVFYQFRGNNFNPVVSFLLVDSDYLYCHDQSKPAP